MALEEGWEAEGSSEETTGQRGGGGEGTARNREEIHMASCLENW